MLIPMFKFEAMTNSKNNEKVIKEMVLLEMSKAFSKLSKSLEDDHHVVLHINDNTTK